jgi:hypothetical protein
VIDLLHSSDTGPPRAEPDAAGRLVSAGRRFLSAVNHRTVVLTLAIGMPLLAARGALTFGSATYDFLRDTRGLLEGGGLKALTPYEPIGYDLLLAPLMAAGLDPIKAGAALSVLTFAIAVLAIRTILQKELRDGAAVALGVLAIVFHETLVTYATQIWAEGVYIAAMAGALAVYAHLSQREYRPATRRQAVLYGIVVAAPTYFSYSGIVVTVIVSGALLYGIAIAAPLDRDERGGKRILTLLLITVAIATVTVSLGRNRYLLGTFSGYPRLTPGYTPVEALQGLVRQIGLDAIGIPYRVAETLSRKIDTTAFTVLTGLGLALLLALTPRRPVPLVIACTLAGHLLWYTYFESTALLDVIGTRIVYPLTPLIAMLLILVTMHRGDGWFRRVGAAAAVMLLLVSAAGGVYKIGRGWRGDHQERIFGYSPRTVDATLQLVRNAPAVGIGVNRYGSQILAYSSRMNIVLIPYVDHLNGSYQEAFGVRTWDEQEARAQFRKQRVEWIVFFEGPTRNDPYAQAGSYGEFIARIRRGAVRGERARIETADGLLIRMDPAMW